MAAPKVENTIQQTSPRTVFLDLVRAAAIIGVVIQHSPLQAMFAPPHAGVSLAGTVVYPAVFNNGGLAVNLFFVLSGLVLSDIRGGVWRFYLTRMARIWPLYIVLILTVWLVKDWPARVLPGLFWRLLTGAHDLMPTVWMPTGVLWVLWSMGVEILFSIALPGILLAGRKMGFWRMAAAALAGAFVYRVFADAGYYADHAQVGVPTLNSAKDNIFGRIDDFIVGMAAARLMKAGWRPKGWMIAAAAVGVLAVGATWNQIYLIHRGLGLSLLVSVLHPAFAIGCAVLILALAGARCWSHAAFRPLAVVGQACFSIYIWHAFFSQRFDLHRPLEAAAYVATTLAVSLFTFAFIEAFGIRRKPAWVARLHAALRLPGARAAAAAA